MPANSPLEHSAIRAYVLMAIAYATIIFDFLSRHVHWQ